MGFKSASNTTVTNDPFETNNLVFSSQEEYKKIQSIDNDLGSLYLTTFRRGFRENIIDTQVREDHIKLNTILDRVEKKINRFDKKVDIIQKADTFQCEFFYINSFLREAVDSKEEQFKTRFTYIFLRLKEIGIFQKEF